MRKGVVMSRQPASATREEGDQGRNREFRDVVDACSERGYGTREGRRRVGRVSPESREY